MGSVAAIYRPIRYYWVTDSVQYSASADLGRSASANHGLAKYQAVGSVATADDESPNVPPMVFDLTDLLIDGIVPGSLMFNWSGHQYYDKDGTIYRDFNPATGAGIPAGTVDYDNGIVTLTNWVAGPAATSIVYMVTRFGPGAMSTAFFRTPGTPVKAESLSVRGTKLDGTGDIVGLSDVDGNIVQTNGSGQLDGFIDYTMGWVELYFKTPDPDNIGIPVVPESVRFNVVTLQNLPLEGTILGLDPVRLPLDGRVPIFRSAQVVVIHSTQDDVLPNPVNAGQTYPTTRDNLAFIKVYDANGAKVTTDKYTVDLDNGSVTFENPLDLSGYTQPLVARTRIEDMLLVSDVQITGYLQLVGSLSRNYDADDTYVSSALLMLDLQGRYEKLFDQVSWTGVWSDVRIGNEANATPNEINYPIAMTNRGSVSERWRLQFINSTQFNLIGETLGQIASGDINNDFAPANPAQSSPAAFGSTDPAFPGNVPYFTIDHRMFGAGWATGNVIRFNTVGANYPLWFARTTLAGPEQEPEDNFKLQIRGDADTE